VIALLGSGGMGEVYRAKDTRLGRDVEIKVLPDAFAKDTDRMRRFEQEARTIAALNHPNILEIHDIGTHEGRPYLVSERLDGAGWWLRFGRNKWNEIRVRREIVRRSVTGR
jgi:eukaryotic-like serine/threonine-protein kinase